eukprot:1320904-Amphidinium_carterae.1
MGLVLLARDQAEFPNIGTADCDWNMTLLQAFVKAVLSKTERSLCGKNTGLMYRSRCRWGTSRLELAQPRVGTCLSPPDRQQS